MRAPRLVLALRRAAFRRRWAGLLVAAMLLALVPAGCAGGGEVAAEELEAAKVRLLQPYQRDFAVVADSLEFDISSIFDAEVARPAVSHTGRLERSEEAGDDVYRWVSAGGLQEPLFFRVGRASFAALQEAVVRVRGSGKPLALDFTATGQVTLRDGGSSIHCQEARVRDGVLEHR
jgi:hypothetical protein